MDFVPTKASLLKSNENICYEAVSFESHKKAENKSTDLSEEKLEKKINVKGFSVKSAKHEVLQLGINGFDSSEKKKLNIQRLIELGAKPPENEYKNYKELKKERQKAEKLKAAQKAFQQLGKNMMGISTAKGKSFDRKRRKEGILNAYGKVKKTKKQIVK